MARADQERPCLTSVSVSVVDGQAQAHSRNPARRLRLPNPTRGGTYRQHRIQSSHLTRKISITPRWASRSRRSRVEAGRRWPAPSGDRRRQAPLNDREEFEGNTVTITGTKPNLYHSAQSSIYRIVSLWRCQRRGRGERYRRYLVKLT